MLTTTDHSRDSAGMTYVYPVVSRRAGGVSVGININVNNACNWACIYCQVPDLVRGGPPPVDLERLESELTRFLTDVLSGDFLQRNVPPDARRLMDIAISGNGEPTSAPEFSEVVERIGCVMQRLGVPDSVKLRLITNGSFLHRAQVRAGIARIGALGGEVWFKLDRATDAGIERVNRVRLSAEKIRAALLVCAGLAPTWIQTCYFAIDGAEADTAEQAAYLEFVSSVKDKIKGVLLYGLARPSLQPESDQLTNIPHESFQGFSERITSLGIEVIATP